MQTNSGQNPTHATAVGVANENIGPLLGV